MKWEKITFGELYKSPTRNGIYKEKSCHGSGVKIVNMGEIFAYDFIGSQDMRRMELTEGEMQNFRLEENDLLFARRSLVESGAGKASIVTNLTEPTTFESSIIRVRLNTKMCCPLFYLYWLRSFSGRAAISTLVTGINVKGIRGSELKDIKVDYPPLAVQRRIAEILSAYDDLIENNQRQIKLLEEAAQRLYKEWFVDFRFPGHESTPITNGIPQGWKKGTVKDVTPILTGKKDANFGTSDGKYFFFTCSQEPIKAPSYSFDASAVILAGNGDFNVKLYRGKFEAYQRTYVLIPNQLENLYLLYNAIYQHMGVLATGASGSTIKFLTKGMIENIPICIPTENVLNQYNHCAATIQQKIECLKTVIISLREARDRLLPKLMSGEIEVVG